MRMKLSMISGFKNLGSSQRNIPGKVTFGIWVVTHSSARERLGYMLLWKCTSCMIILYSRLNGVHPIPYLVNMSHLICVRECLSCVSPTWASRENTAWPGEPSLSVVHPRPPRLATWMGFFVCLFILNIFFECVRERISIITPHTPRAFVSEEPWSQAAPHVPGSCKSRMTERHRGNKSMKH